MISRRHFLKTSAMAGPAAMAAVENSPAASASGPLPSAAQKSYRMNREIPVEEGFDLIVAGGGPGGAAAAICAARLGAKVLLIEATGCLGGMGTSGLVTSFNPMADGERMLVGGLMREIVTTMHARGFLGPQVTSSEWYTRSFHRWTPFQAEGLKVVLDELAAEAKVEVRFFTRVVDADVDAAQSTVRAVITHNIEGFQCLRAKTFVDGTGDAVLADLCGVRCREAGSDTPNIMPPTLCSLCGNIDWTRVEGQQRHLEQAIAEKHFSHSNRHMPGMQQVGRTTGFLNAGHVFQTNALVCRSLSDSMIAGRKLVQEYISFFRKYVPGCENLEHVTTAHLMGVRESRRIVGEYELTFDDFLARRQFPDQIGVFNCSVDIHVYGDSDEEYQRYAQMYAKTGRLKPGECYGIPYGILVPKGWRNLWVAGRSNSSDIEMHGAIRVQPAAYMMGQAAGTAAVQSLATGQAACDLNTGQLVATLRRNGAYLPQPALSETMTR